MAIVKNKALNSGPNPGSTSSTDHALDSYSRTNAGEPNSSLTPAFAGEIVLDTTNNCLWKAMGVGSTTWVALTPPN
jgi:hypothetical protein